MSIARDAVHELLRLLRREQVAMAEFIVALAEFDRRRGWLELGYAGLFPFLQRELGLPKSGAFLRKSACELVQRYPELVQHFREGRLCLSVVAELARVVTPENSGDVIPRFLGLSRREAKEVAAAIAPAAAPARRAVVTTVPPRRGAEVRPEEPKERKTPVENGAVAASPATELLREPAVPPPVLLVDAAAVPDRRRARAPDTTTDPLTSELRRLHVTVTRRFLDKLEAARDALSHARPGASVEEVLEAGLDLLLDRAAKRKGLVSMPQARARGAAPDHVPARVKREVWQRDGGKCQWPLQGGGVCGSTLRVEFDHLHPRALGGTPTPENLTLRCAVHNAVAARRVFGDAWMDRFTARGRGPIEEPFTPVPPPG